MADFLCEGCRERDLAINQLKAQVAELERFQRETTYLRDEARTERDLRLLTGDSQGMKAVRLAIQQVAQTHRSVKRRRKGRTVAVANQSVRAQRQRCRAALAPKKPPPIRPASAPTSPGVSAPRNSPAVT